DLKHAVYGARDKLAAAEPLLAQLGASWDEVAVMGDDWPDLPLMTRAGFACAPPGAHAEVLAIAHHVTRAAGGYGAAREYCDVLLMAAGHYERLLNTHHDTLDGGKAS
ncbi:KdsC family phosphatase, partial [Roseateles sp. P5_E11]